MSPQNTEQSIGYASGWDVGSRPRFKRGLRGGWWWFAWCGAARRDGVADTKRQAQGAAIRAEMELRRLRGYRK